MRTNRELAATGDRMHRTLRQDSAEKYQGDLQGMMLNQMIEINQKLGQMNQKLGLIVDRLI